MKRQQTAYRQGFEKRMSLVAVLAVLALPGLGQATAPAPQDLTARQPEYTVASIKPHKLTSDGSSWSAPSQDGYTARNVSVKRLIERAYAITSPDQLSGLPEWAIHEMFDIEAKLDDDAVPAFHKLSADQQREQAALMLQSLLADRFKLKVHRETRQLPVYALVIAKDGPKLKEVDPKENLGSPDGMVTNRGKIYTRGGPVNGRFLFGLSDAVGRIVVDKTGLTGKYDISLNWNPDEMGATDDTGPSIFTSIQEQLGLKLVPAKAPVDTIVVDHVERPSEN